MSNVTIAATSIADILTKLVGRDVDTSPSDAVATHVATYRGLVTNDGDLVAVIGCDLDFAHRSAAALAMIPAGSVSDEAKESNPELIEIYGEVANVISRLVDEATPVRVRLDPAVSHPADSMTTIVNRGSCAVACTASIEGYGSGSLGVWHRFT